MKVIYEDNHIIVAKKRPGVISQADGKDNDDMMSKVKAYLKEKYEKPGDVYLGLLHRLDKPAGGLMIFARTSKAAGRLSEQIRNKDVRKYYLTVVVGRIRPLKGRLEGYIKKDREKNISCLCDKNDDGAKFAALSYEVLCGKEEYSLVAIDLITGRSHQIRVQLASIGHPIAGDRKYSKDDRHYTVALWAYKLIFTHPVTKQKMTFVSLPEKRGIWNMFDYKELM